MYNYEWDIDTGGYVLNTKISGVTKELRPVFFEELDLLGFDKFWRYPKTEKPLLWAETRRYMYRGRFVAEAVGGGLYSKPTIKIYEENLIVEPVEIEMIKKNKSLMDGFIQKTLEFIYNSFNEYKKKRIDVFYVAFSGGKDSIVLLDLVQRALPHNEFKVIFGDTSMEISDTYKAVEKAKERWNTLEFYTAKSHLDATDSWEKFGPPSRTQRWCCSVHKSAPSLLKLREIVGKDNLKAFVFDGIRAEESDARATYDIISDGDKHKTQNNCHPILEWNTAELFLYMFANDLFFNKAYRFGLIRVGCALCPTASSWWEAIANQVYKQELMTFSNILDNNAKEKISDENERIKYIDSGGWKGRKGGIGINSGGNKIIEQEEKNKITINVLEINSDWKEWIKAIGKIIEIESNKYIIEYKKNRYIFNVEECQSGYKVYVDKLDRNLEFNKFMSLIKNVFNKAAYCNYCRVCMVECPTGALKITNGKIEIDEKCIHCERCLVRQRDA